MSIQIVTDSCSGITASEAKKLGILILPIPFTVGETEYLDSDALDLSTLPML